MKKLILICFLFVVLTKPAFARDFIVEFVEENYKETQARFSYDPLIYHSIQVNSSSGPKMLILTGDDYHYRKWLRQYIARNKKFITKIPDELVNEFISSKAFEIDVTSLHPFNGGKWKRGDLKDGALSTIEGDNHILIVDPNEKRTGLIQTIVEKMGYRATIFKTGKQALELFQLQPQKFKMVIAHYTISGMSPGKFIEEVLELNNEIPVVIDTGYKNQDIKNQFLSKFSGFKSVHIKPVILNDLQKTIQTFVKINA